ncbi:CsbD family protein [Lichenibacterium ramalinae]|nr:CsbD family protein [Lichenibacterium ramalinae]
MNRNRMEGALRDAAGQVEQTFGMVTGDAGRRGAGVAHEVAGKGQNLYGRAQDGIEDAADAARNLAGRVADRTTDAYDDVRRDLRRGAAPLRRRLERSPLAALVVVGVAGYALGLLSNSVRR